MNRTITIANCTYSAKTASSLNQYGAMSHDHEHSTIVRETMLERAVASAGPLTIVPTSLGLAEQSAEDGEVGTTREVAPPPAPVPTPAPAPAPAPVSRLPRQRRNSRRLTATVPHYCTGRPPRGRWADSPRDLRVRRATPATAGRRIVAAGLLRDLPH